MSIVYVCMSVCLSVCLSDDNFRQPWHRNFIFCTPGTVARGYLLHSPCMFLAITITCIHAIFNFVRWFGFCQINQSKQQLWAVQENVVKLEMSKDSTVSLVHKRTSWERWSASPSASPSAGCRWTYTSCLADYRYVDPDESKSSPLIIFPAICSLS